VRKGSAWKVSRHERKEKGRKVGNEKEKEETEEKKRKKRKEKGTACISISIDKPTNHVLSRVFYYTYLTLKHVCFNRWAKKKIAEKKKDTKKEKKNAVFSCRTPRQFTLGEQDRWLRPEKLFARRLGWSVSHGSLFFNPFLVKLAASIQCNNAEHPT